jgi:hypothetical protein
MALPREYSPEDVVITFAGAGPEWAKELSEVFLAKCEEAGIKVLSADEVRGLIVVDCGDRERKQLVDMLCTPEHLNARTQILPYERPILHNYGGGPRDRWGKLL